MISLVCIDVDGTFVGQSHEPSEAVWEACDEAKNAGLTLAISTGRAGFGRVDDYAKTLNPQGWHSFHNGAALVNYGTGELRMKALAPEMLDFLSTLADGEPDWCLEFYTLDSYGVNQQHRFLDAHAAMLGFEPQFGDHTTFGDIVRVQIVVPLIDVARISELLGGFSSGPINGEKSEANPAAGVAAAAGTAAAAGSSGFDVSFATSPSMPNEAFISITSKGVNKGHALEVITEETGTALAASMMVGDGNNDVEALKLAGVGVAMGNADESAKAVADYVVSSVEDDGLVEAIKIALGS